MSQPEKGHQGSISIEHWVKHQGFAFHHWAVIFHFSISWELLLFNPTNEFCSALGWWIGRKSCTPPHQFCSCGTAALGLSEGAWGAVCALQPFPSAGRWRELTLEMFQEKTTVRISWLQLAINFARSSMSVPQRRWRAGACLAVLLDVYRCPPARLCLEGPSPPQAAAFQLLCAGTASCSLWGALLQGPRTLNSNLETVSRIKDLFVSTKSPL